MARAPNDYGTMGPQHTPPNPSQRNGLNPPGAPPSHSATVSPGSATGIPNTDPAALARRVRGGDDPAQGGPGGANRRP
jgi:hypothetical protein